MDWTDEEMAEFEAYYGTGTLTQDEVVPRLEHPDLVEFSDEEN